MKATITMNIEYSEDTDATHKDVESHLELIVKAAADMGIFHGFEPELHATDMRYTIAVDTKFMYFPVPKIRSMGDEELAEELDKAKGEHEFSMEQWAKVLEKTQAENPELKRRKVIALARDETHQELANEGMGLEHDIFHLENEMEHRRRNRARIAKHISAL